MAIPSVSHDEAALADRVAALLDGQPHLEVRRVGANVVARTHLGRGARVILAGHLDTVPADGNAAARLQGDTLWGLGSADMKGGLAVMLALAEALSAPALDVTYVFYTGEEVAREHNGLLAIAAAAPHLLECDAAILGEPTSALVEAGCQGVLKVEVTVGGARAHAARPWMGANAIHRMAPVLDRVATYQPRLPVIDGCHYRETLQAMAVSAGVAGNVVPDQAVLMLNHRFAPDRDPRAAEAMVRDLIEPLLDPTRGDNLRIVEGQAGAAPHMTHPVLQALLKATGSPPRAKLGWTDVAFFAARGIPAANFGPGDPELAHTADERLDRADVDRAYATLLQLLSLPG